MTRQEVCAGIEALLGVPGIARFLQFGRERDSARMAVQFDDGRTIHLGGADVLFSQAEFGKAIMLNLGIVPQRLSTKDWAMTLGHIFTACVDVEEDPDSGLVGRVREWLRVYAQDAVERDGEVIGAREPFTHEGATYVFAESLRRHVRAILLETVSADEVRTGLRLLGCDRQTISYSRPGSAGHSTASYYRVPSDVIGGQ